MSVDASRLLYGRELGGAAYKMGPVSRGSELSCNNRVGEGGSPIVISSKLSPVTRRSLMMTTNADGLVGRHAKS